MAAPSSGTVSDAESGPGRLAPPGRAVEDLARLDDRELLGIVRSLPRGGPSGHSRDPGPGHGEEKMMNRTRA
jgi:hypothetical protein